MLLHVYIIFPLLKVFETRIVSGSKCQSERIRATSTPRMSQNLQNICRNVGFSKRIFENFASGNRLCSRKNRFCQWIQTSKKIKLMMQRILLIIHDRLIPHPFSPKAVNNFNSSPPFGLYDIFNYLI